MSVLHAHAQPKLPLNLSKSQVSYVLYIRICSSNSEFSVFILLTKP